MRNLRKVLIVSLLAAGLTALLALSPDAAVQAASSDKVSTSFSSSSTDCNYALGQQASGDWREAVEYFDKTVTDDAETYDEAYNHDKRRLENDEDDDDEDDDG